MVSDRDSSEDVQRRVLKWIVDVSPSASAETMAQWLGFRIRRMRGVQHPESYRDMTECLDLLKSVPELEKDIPALSELSPEWAVVVKDWNFMRSATGRDIQAIIQRETSNLQAPSASAGERQPEGRGG